MAVFNGGYPATYQPLYQPYTPVQPQQQNASAQSGSLIWIQGEQAAKSYLVAPNSSVVLFDSESQSIYIKSADASGMPSMKILDYTIRDSAKNVGNNPVTGENEGSVTYATKEEINGLNDQIKALKTRMDKLVKRMKEETEDE